MRNDSRRPVPPTLVDANRLWVDSRVRALVQRRVEAPVLLRLGGPVPGGRVLELGTGRRGTGLRLALEVFGAAHADGVEQYDASVAACREAVRDLGGRVEVQRGDATALTAPDGSYAAVFGYHVLHHAGAWRGAGRGAPPTRPRSPPRWSTPCPTSSASCSSGTTRTSPPPSRSTSGSRRDW